MRATTARLIALRWCITGLDPVGQHFARPFMGSLMRSFRASRRIADGLSPRPKFAKQSAPASAMFGPTPEM